MTSIEGKVAVVTGAAAGIGRGIAEQLMAEGATVVLADIEESALQRTSEELGSTGLRVDVADSTSVRGLADQVMAQFGRVDIVVNNAGVGPQSPVADLTLADWRWLVDVNLFGVVHGVNHFLPLLKANPDGGHIVATTSMSAFAPMSGLGAYAATKSAVTALMEVLAAELSAEGSAVHATILAPGNVRSEIARSLRNRPGDEKSAFFDVDMAKLPPPPTGRRWIDAIDAGRVLTRAIRENRLYAITHPEQWWRVEERNERIRTAFSEETTND